ncbi:glycosyltransferase [Candidatus Uhrbacteria bacterium]|nr:glycosyltransferase [Candidatus Uhrbacteria bacterium]
MDNSPLVSVVMSVYNGERHLRESLDSLLAQTYPHLEIILVNDGSRDRSREMIATYQDPRIVCIDRQENLGLTKSLNEGVRRARGVYVARLDVGDVALPNRIERQVHFLEQHPEVGILGCGIAFFAHVHTLREYTYATEHARIAELLQQFANPLPHSTLMFRRSVLERLEGYRPQFARSQDYDLLLRAIAVTTLASLPEVLVRWRFEPGSLTFGSGGQLAFGIAALVRARHRLLGHKDVLSDEEWTTLLQRVQVFIRRHHLDVRMGASKHRILAQCAFGEQQWRDMAMHLARLVTQSPLFFVHTRTRLSAFIADHAEELLPCAYVCGR